MDEALIELQEKLDNLGEEGLNLLDYQLNAISPEEGKYANKVNPLREYLSVSAEWNACAKIQYLLLETRSEFGKAPKTAVEKLEKALPKAKPQNMKLLEDILRHDQLAVIKELGRVAGPEIEALLHPGTTSYDILDTARSYLLKKVWNEQVRPAIKKFIIGDEKNIGLAELAEKSRQVIQKGRTHLQDTSPITIGGFLANYVGRLTERIERCDLYFNDLRGKINGIVGTYAGVEMVIGEGKGIEFEKKTLEKLGLEPDYTSTQIVQKERLADVGHGISTLAGVLGDLANDIRILYQSSIGELTSSKNEAQLGLSSTDANKNNPINWEHIAGMVIEIQSGMQVLNNLISSDLQRDLRGSVIARYQPQTMIAQTYRVFNRATRALQSLSVVDDRLKENMQTLRDFPSEAMTTILRGEGFNHPTYGTGHGFVKEISKTTRKEKARLIDIALRDETFKKTYEQLTPLKQSILQGSMEHYLGSLQEKITINLEYAKKLNHE